MNDISQSPPPVLSTLTDALARQVDRIAERETARGLAPDAALVIARRIVFDRLTADADRADRIGQIDIEAALASFLSGRRSTHTATAYKRAWHRLRAWCDLTGHNPLAMTAAEAEDFCRAESDTKQRPASVRSTVHGLSSFFLYLGRHYEFIRNPWHRLPNLPPEEHRPAVIPTAGELDAIESAARAREDVDLADAVLVLRATGCRIGALGRLTIDEEGHWTARSKGKNLASTEPIPAGILARLADRLPRPFAGAVPENIRKRFYDLTRRLADDGKLGAAYSVHDVRHFYAAALFDKTRDLYRTSRALGHASVAVTEQYLLNVLGRDPRRMP